MVFYGVDVLFAEGEGTKNKKRVSSSLHFHYCNKSKPSKTVEPSFLREKVL